MIFYFYFKKLQTKTDDQQKQTKKKDDHPNTGHPIDLTGLGTSAETRAPKI